MVMRITVTEEGRASVITVSGEEDTRSEEAFHAAFRECFERGCYSIVLDLSKLKYLGSRLRKVLLANTKEALAAGGKVKLLDPHPNVKNFLRDNRLLDFFEVYNIRQAAIESFEEEQKSKPATPAETKSEPVEPKDKPVPQNMEERMDRLENSLIQLVNILRQRGTLSDSDEDQVFG